MCLAGACSPGVGGSRSDCLEATWAGGFSAVLAPPWTTALCALCSLLGSWATGCGRGKSLGGEMASRTADEQCLISRGLLTTTCFVSCLLHRPLSLRCHPSLPKLQASPSLIRPTDLRNRLVCIAGLRSFPPRRQHRVWNKCRQRKGPLQVQNV